MSGTSKRLEAAIERQQQEHHDRARRIREAYQRLGKAHLTTEDLDAIVPPINRQQTRRRE